MGLTNNIQRKDIAIYGFCGRGVFGAAGKRITIHALCRRDDQRL